MDDYENPNPSKPPTKKTPSDEKHFLRQATGRFIRPKKQPPPTLDKDALEQPTQKIILFPIELVKDDPPTPRMGPVKPPIMFTAPLPKIPDLPKVEALPDDFMAEGELDELEWDNQPKSPDFSKFLKGEDEDDIENSIRDFPKEHRKLAQLIQELSEKADKYADSMFVDFENEDVEEVERLERLIPGTDSEEGKRIVAPPPRKRVKWRRTPQLPPDIPAGKLERYYAKGLEIMKIRRLLLVFLSLISLLLTLFPSTLPQLDSTQSQIIALSGLLLFGFLAAFDVLLLGFQRGLHLKFGMDTLCIFSGIFCALDCFVQYSTPTPRGQLPYVSLLLLSFTLLLYGEEQKRRSNRRACRTAARIEHPFLITLEKHKWNGKSAYTKSSSQAQGFTSQLQQDDGTQLFFSYLSPLFLIGSFLMAIHLTSTTEDFVWALSALLIVSTPLATSMVYGRAANKVGKRLAGLQSSLAGWTGVSSVGQQCIVSDLDLFPVGCVKLNGTVIYTGFSEKKVLGYTSALVNVGKLGCGHLFDEMMTVRNFITPSPRELAYHDAGGISARIGADAVLVGNADFMELMHVDTPEGMHVNHIIFCAINGRLGGVFTLVYDLPFSVEQSMESLYLERIRPILATRDFALTPTMLEHRFGIRRKQVEFPSILRRQELSRSDRPQEGQLTALLSREGLEPISDCVIAAGRLRRTVYWGNALSLFAAVLGFALVSYLVSQLSYTALSPWNLTIFMCLWLPPFWILTDLPQRF